MRLDNRYFNLFIAVCALLTLVVIIYGSISYHQRQEATFRENAAAADLHQLEFEFLTDNQTLSLASLRGRPVVIHFWAGWSERSAAVHESLQRIRQENPDLAVIAALVRDDEEELRNRIRSFGYDFYWVSGTGFYQELQVPGIPSQLLIGRDGLFFDLQVGEDETALAAKIRNLIDHE